VLEKLNHNHFGFDWVIGARKYSHLIFFP